MVVLDPGLVDLLDPTEGMKDGGVLVMNTRKAPGEVETSKGSAIRIAAVDADRIAIEELGRPIVNTTMIGAFIKATGLISIDDIKGPLLERFGSKLGERNLKAMERAYNEVVIKG